MLIRIGIHGERKKPLAEQVPTTRISNRQFTTAGFTNRKLSSGFPPYDYLLKDVWKAGGLRNDAKQEKR
jgi:hypothetical protein